MAVEPTHDTLSEAAHRGPNHRARTEPHLVLALECDRPLGGGARYSLADVDEVVVGRGAAREVSRGIDGGGGRLIVGVADRWMSATHATIFRRAGAWVVEDATSTNGTFVNGTQITSATSLASDDLVEIGHTLFYLRSGLEVPSNAADGAGDASEPTRTVRMATLVPTLAAQLDALARVAPTDIPVLLLGPTGTGKEVMARAIHELSGRAGPFVAVNCGALPESLLESQLFGHVKGAFSGAQRDAVGFVQSAHQGTLFLDEIGELSMRSQAALLRVLEEHEVVPVGATRPIAVNSRVVAATHRPIDELAARGGFRSDLLARLTGLSVTLPALRDRRDDLGILVADILRDIAPARAQSLSFAIDAGRACAVYDWPLNIRELRQALRLAIAMTDGAVIELSHLPKAISAARAPRPRQEAAALSIEDERLRAELLAHLDLAGGNISEVARAMGRARTQVHRWLKRFSIDPASFRK